DRRPRPRVVGDAVEVGEEAVLLPERQLLNVGAGEERAAVVDRVPRLRREDEPAVAVAVEHHEGEVEDSLLAPVGRDYLPLGIELDAEAAAAPGRDRLPKLRQAFRQWVARDRLEALGERAADEWIRFL